MYRVLVTLVFVFLICSCDRSFKAPKPEKLIEESIMEEILYDAKLISAARSKNFKKTKDSNVVADQYIYHKYNIDSLTLKQNLDYYATASFKDFKRMEDNIRLRFEKEKNDIVVELKRIDSLKKPKEIKSKKEVQKKLELTDKEKKELYKGRLNRSKN